MFILFSDRFISQLIDTYGGVIDKKIADSDSEASVSQAVRVLVNEKFITTLLFSSFLLTIIMCLFLAGRLMGYENFLKANLSFGSILIVTVGVIIVILSLLYRSIINLGNEYKLLPWVLLLVGFVAVIIGVAGLVIGLIPDRCGLALYIYMLLLLILLVIFFVFGLIILYFPSLFFQTFVEVITLACKAADSHDDKNPCLDVFSFLSVIISYDFKYSVPVQTILQNICNQKMTASHMPINPCLNSIYGAYVLKMKFWMK